ncbi:MAG TPA: aminoacyl-tRNA hydrolase [Candidatus Limnocylindrales bacterium]|nr:aminoacyl-tRNA hydrolase [Candidatus Limnocylindrales bacterium]
MKIVVGLGNPGNKYDATRHNIGFLFIDRVARQQGIVLDHYQCDALAGKGRVNETTLLLAKPQTFMNRSGVAVAALLQEQGASPADLIVVHDDLDLPFGRIRIRTNGGAGGHRGVMSIIEHLGNAAFCRLRLGIGRPPEDLEVIEYVLAPFNESELGDLTKLMDRATEALCCLLDKGAEAAMAIYNRVD